MKSSMAKLNIELPPHCQIKKRKGRGDVYYAVYFMPHPKDRPEGWKPTVLLGRTDQTKPEAIGIRAHEVYDEYLAFKGQALSPGVKEGTFPDIIAKYRASHLYKDNAPKTRKDYDHYCREIHEWSAKNAHPHISELRPSAIIRFLNKYENTPVKQDRMKNVLRLLCMTAVAEGYLDASPITRDSIKLRRRQTKKREVVLWSEEDIDRFVAECDARGLNSLGSIALTMIETAQRKGDVISMRTGISYKDGELAYVQSKTGKTVWLVATDKLKERYEKYPSKDYFMFVNETTQKQWNEYTVTHKTREILDHLGLKDHRLMELRHSQVNYLFELGCSDEDITAMTGHEKPETMRKHYREKVNKKRADKVVVRINEHRKKRAQR